jgi:hypothetical protein
MVSGLLAQGSTSTGSLEPFHGKARDLHSHPFLRNQLLITLRPKHVIGGGIPGFDIQVENPTHEPITFNPNDMTVIDSRKYQVQISEVQAFGGHESLSSPLPVSILPGAFITRNLVFSGLTIGVNPPIKIYYCGKLFAEISEK